MPTKRKSNAETTEDENENGKAAPNEGDTPENSTSNSKQSDDSGNASNRSNETEKRKESGTTERRGHKPAWLIEMQESIANQSQAIADIREMVKPKETPNGADTKIVTDTGKEAKVTTHQEKPPPPEKRTPPKQGHRRLTIFKFHR